MAVWVITEEEASRVIQRLFERSWVSSRTPTRSAKTRRVAQARDKCVISAIKGDAGRPQRDLLGRVGGSRGR